MAGSRRRARELALQALYEMDIAGHEPVPTLERLIDDARFDEQFAATVAHAADRRDRAPRVSLMRSSPAPLPCGRRSSSQPWTGTSFVLR